MALNGREPITSYRLHEKQYTDFAQRCQDCVNGFTLVTVEDATESRSFFGEKDSARR